MKKKGGNPENLKGHGFHERTAEEQREIARKGGIASGEARRRKRDWKQKANAMLSTQLPKEQAKKLKALGVDENSADWDDVILAALIQKAAKGNVMAINALAGITGNDQYLKAKQAEVRIKRMEANIKQAELEERRREYDLDREDRKAANEGEDDLAAAWLDAVIQTSEENDNEQQI